MARHPRWTATNGTMRTQSMPGRWSTASSPSAQLSTSRRSDSVNWRNSVSHAGGAGQRRTHAAGTRSRHRHPSGLRRSPHGANRRLAGPPRVLEIAGIMKTRLLGRTGISVSQLCFGTMSFGGDADEATSAAMFKAVRDAGINFFDSANEYSKGKSEEILGRLMKGERDDLVIA